MLDILKNRMAKIAEKSKEISDSLEDQFHKMKLSEEDRNQRFDICKSCDKFYEPASTCKICHCFMAAKTYIPSSSCPLNKWQIKIEQK